MMESVNGVTCIKGEIHSIITLMRLNSRWSQNSRISRESLYNDEGHLMKSFRKLNEYLDGLFDLAEVDSVSYITPFYDVIVSDKANGPLTSAALSSLSKFVLYGFLSRQYPHAIEGVALIAGSISHCVFEETDWESDELILMKLLELSVLSFRCNASIMLTIGAAWDVYSTCISIHNHYRASKILKSEAKNALVHLTLTTFSRASLVAAHSADSNKSSALDLKDEFSAQLWDSACQRHHLGDEGGVGLILGKIMSVLAGLCDLQRNPPETVKFALSLVNVALEAGGLSIGSVPVLVEMLGNDICRNLLRASQSDDLAILSLALRVVFNLFVSIKDHMKVQLEVFLTSVHLRLINGSSGSGSASQNIGGSAIVSAKEELALESLLEFCREPSLMQDLYTNYDCDVQCTNLFDLIIQALCMRALPRTLLPSVRFVGGGTQAVVGVLPATDDVSFVTQPVDVRLNILNKLALDGLLTVLRSVATKCATESVSSEMSSASKRHRERTSANSIGYTSPEKSSLKPNVLGACCDFEVDRLATEPPNSAVKLDNFELTSAYASVAPIDLQVDRWCESSDEASSSFASEADFDDRGRHESSGDHWQMVVSRHHSTGSRSDAADSFGPVGPTPVDGENEEISAVLEARAKGADMLRQRKLMKSKFKLAGDKFNIKPLKSEWIRFAIEIGILKPIDANSRRDQESDKKSSEDIPLADARSVAEFLRYTPGLGKTQIGEYISKGPPDKYPFHKQVLLEYARLFDFSGPNSGFDKALRMFLGHFRLPGEAQCIDRIMEAFAGHLFTHLGPNKPFASADAAFILAFSTILLNTDLHNPGIPLNKKMTKVQFVRNNRGINDQKDLPTEYLEGLYDEIKTRQIQVDIGVADTTQFTVDYTDTATWNKLIRQGSTDQAPAIFTPTLAARKSVSSDLLHQLGGTAGGGAYRFLGAFPTSSLQDRDMFLMMSRPLLETLVVLWEATADDHVVFRVFQGFWDYAQVCLDLSLHCMLSSLVQLLAIRSRETMIRSRSQSSSASGKAFLHRGGLAYKSNYNQWKADSGHELMELVSLDFELLVTASDKNSADREHNTNWTEAALVKGELLVKIVFQLVAICPQALTQDAWVAVIELLVWSRSRGALPKELATLTDSFGDLNDQQVVSDSALKKAASFPLPSLYSRSSHLSAYGVPTTSLPVAANKLRPSAPTELPSISRGGGSWLSSLFFLEAEADDALTAGVQLNMHSESTNSLLESPALYNNANSSKFVSLTGEALRSDDELLQLSLATSGSNRLFATHTDDVTTTDDAIITVLLSSLLECLHHTLEALTAIASTGSVRLSPEKTKVDLISVGPDSYFPDHLLTSSSLSVRSAIVGASELDFVVVLEWLFLLVSSSTSRLLRFWSKMHAFFRVIFEDKLDQLSEQHPYIIERCVVAILRSTVQLVCVNTECASHTLATSLSSSALVSGISGANVMSAVSTVESVWISLRLMRGMSGDLITNLSGRIGFGVLCMIKATRHTTSPLNLEQWYMIFSLLSAATSGPEGRAFVWSAICFLMEQDMVGDINFTPCRHLVLRYLHGVFPGELATHEKDGQTHGAHHNQWVLPSMGHLLHMTLMVLAGLFKTPPSVFKPSASYQDPSSASTTVPRTPVKESPSHDRAAAKAISSTEDFVSFPMPPPFMFSPTRPLDTRELLGSPRIEQRAETSVTKTQPPQVQSVKCIRLGKPDEVELLWLETCKIFSELTNSAASSVSQQAVDCLRRTLTSGRFAHLTDAVWLKCLNELISRLPLHYSSAAGRLASGHSVDGLFGADSVDICHRCCNVVFDVMLENVRQMRENVEFQSIWIRFVSTLATNAALTHKNALQLSRQQPFFHDEVMGMLEALLRLLKTPPMVLSSDVPPLPVPLSLIPVDVAPKSEAEESREPAASSVTQVVPSAYYGVFSWFTAAVPQNIPAAKSVSVVEPAVKAVRSPAPLVGGQSPVQHAMPQMVYDMESGQSHDGALITSSWKTILSMWPLFAASLRQKNPKLVSSILLYLECAERHLRRKTILNATPSIDVHPLASSLVINQPDLQLSDAHLRFTSQSPEGEQLKQAPQQHILQPSQQQSFISSPNTCRSVIVQTV